jgi:muramoyltetrapeptide carboxypeptidase
MHICVLAPSACVDVDPIQLAQQRLLDYGVHVSSAAHLYAQHRYLAGTAEVRIADLQAASIDPQIDAIWCGRGGTGAAQLLPFLDHWLLNKPLIGYSDSTVLLNFIAMHGGQAIHGPVFQEIALKNLRSKQDLSSDAQQVLALLTADQPHHHYPLQAASSLATTATPLSGKILGGNLCTLCSLQGTPWALELQQPSILLVEDVGEAYYRLERLLLQLLQSIDLKHLIAVVMGDFHHCPQHHVAHSLHEIFAEHLDRAHIPLFRCDWFGHGSQNRPFWLGKQGVIQNQSLII